MKEAERLTRRTSYKLEGLRETVAVPEDEWVWVNPQMEALKLGMTWVRSEVGNRRGGMWDEGNGICREEWRELGLGRVTVGDIENLRGDGKGV